MFTHPPDLHFRWTQDLGRLPPAADLSPISPLPPSLWPEWCAARLARLPAGDYPVAGVGDQSKGSRDGLPARAALLPVSNGRVT